MTTGDKPWRLDEAAKQGPPRLRWLTAPIKGIALVVGGCVTMLAGVSLVGLLIETVWIQIVLAAIPAIGLPLLTVDRLLPKEGGSRPGLLTDVAALAWMGIATGAVAVGTTSLQGPLEAEALRLDDAGMKRSAWAMRWMAGVDTPTSVVAQAEDAPEPEPDEAEDDDGASKSSQPGAEFTPAPDDTDRAALEPASLFKTWAPSVVAIKVETRFGGGMGTGFVIDERGTIATNHHVVEEATSIRVKLFDGSEVDEVSVLETNPEQDLALIRVRSEIELEPVVLGSSEKVTVGEPVIVIGNPIGLEHTLTDGLVSARRLWQGKRYIQMSAPVSPGNSGGPVFNAYGDVVGVTVAKLAGENLNLAVPIDLLKPMIKDEYPGAQDLGKSRW